MKSLVVADNKTNLYPSLVPNLAPLPLNSSNGGFPSSTNISPLPNSFINLDQGDPVLFEAYWKRMSEECTVEIKGCELLSYLSDLGSVCWFMKPELRDAIKKLHALVGNAETNDRHIVVGNGSTQLFQAALFALSSSLSSSDDENPINVVAAAPYYSEYPDQTNILRSGLHKWHGDAVEYDKNEAYIEVVTSPNNPDGSIREPVVNNKSGGEGKLIHDLAYYWPHYTPITHKAKHDLMLFTFSKCTGHAGSRIGWAIVKDTEIAKKMTKFIQMSSIGVSKESQTRVVKIIEVLCDSYKNFKLGSKESELFFEHSRSLMKERWEKLREVVKQNGDFSLPKFQRAYCNFTNESSETYPAFAWLNCKKEDENCEGYLEKKLKILVRSGIRFGSDPRYARISMLVRGDDFDEFLKRLSNI
ncbi:L-tryptophan--pyruvate aminotransferase 1-like [Prosopis cineraria]|uniref:L-tryptophan--pyruvate aminotransferase 1-like n=1 Tax=Prosopis cineraria TaxID=364024 RepID=UPI00241079D2|nr:L-tryptophan--pyruvate aminotransferase 1-like [Prosopis cineraria]